MSSRQRLSGEEARARILDAAVPLLREVGPHGLKLTDIAHELGLSHQAILHHFGSREGLLGAVLRRALDQLQHELMGGLRVIGEGEQEPRGVGVLLERTFDVISDQGYGRLIAWLELTYPSGGTVDLGPEPLRVLSELTQAFRARQGTDANARDTAFLVLLVTYAVLGSAIFETSALRAAGLGDDPNAGAAFRVWLGELILRQLRA